jgi:hypothetical protein
MIVREPHLRRGGDRVALRTELVSETGAFRARTVSIELERKYEGWLDVSGNPFVPAATALATAIGEDLTIDAPVSPQLVDGAERASRLYSGWWDYRPARVHPVRTEVAVEPGPGTGLFFSNGTDSVTTLLRSLEGTIPERVTHLLSLQGLNPHLSRRNERRVWRGLSEAADEYGLPLVRLRTDLVGIVREQMGWTRSFGAVLAGTALALGPLLGRVLFGATVDDAHPRPRGSHPDLDPLWGTERTGFRQDATELGKMNRVLLVGANPLALRHLKVCWAANTAGNCGRCFKCLKTMTTLALLEDDDWTAAFEQPLTPEAILAQDLRLAQLYKVENELVPTIRSQLPELAEAWAQRAQEVRSDGPRRPWAARQARNLRHRGRRMRRRAAKSWRQARRRAALALGRG